MSKEKYDAAHSFVKEHFTVIKSDDALYNYKDILLMTKKLINKDNYKGLLIDPYNSLKIDLPPNSKISTHEYHYEALSEIKLFGKIENISTYINMHAITSALREKDAKGYRKAPGKAETEGGSKSANKADEFVTIHRLVDHEDDWMWTEIHVRKVKETETGGKITPLNKPIKLRGTKGLTGFETENGFNVIKNYRQINPQTGIDYTPIIKTIDFSQSRFEQEQEINFEEPKTEPTSSKHWMEEADDMPY
jgi:hypothetical protein